MLFAGVKGVFADQLHLDFDEVSLLRVIHLRLAFEETYAAWLVRDPFLKYVLFKAGHVRMEIFGVFMTGHEANLK